MEKKFNVFISSVMNETGEERDLTTQYHPELFEYLYFEEFPGEDRNLKEICLEGIKKSNLFILILSQSISDIVAYEFNVATQREIPRLVFIKDLPPNQRDKKLSDFIDNDVGTKLKYERYTDKESFCKALRRSIAHELVSKFEEISGLELSINNLMVHNLITKFESLKMYEVKSPLELIKSSPGDKLVEIMNQIANKPTYEAQIKCAERLNFIKEYANSWADKEQQLIGFFLLKRIINKYLKKPPKKFELHDLYDIGCGNCAQLKAVKALNRFPTVGSSKKFKYIGQDYIEGWEIKVKALGGEKFMPLPLPLTVVEGVGFSLISCTHTLHYLAKNPIALYTSLQSFNRSLAPKGFCYITIPEKTAWPGLLDLIKRSAHDALFEIVESGKYRMTHELRKPPGNVTTFSYLILKKRRDLPNTAEWRKYVNISLYLAGERDRASKTATQIKKDIKQLELFIGDLTEILRQKEPSLRAFRCALDIVQMDFLKLLPDLKTLIDKIETSIYRVHAEYKTGKPEEECNLKQELAKHFFWLVGYILKIHPQITLETKLGIYKIVKKIFSEREDIRINLEDWVRRKEDILDETKIEITREQLAKIFTQLFDLSRYEGIDLSEILDEYIEPINNELYDFIRKTP